MNNFDRATGTLGIVVSLFALFVVLLDKNSFLVATIVGVLTLLMIFLSACFLLNLIPKDK